MPEFTPLIGGRRPNPRVLFEKLGDDLHWPLGTVGSSWIAFAEPKMDTDEEVMLEQTPWPRPPLLARSSLCVIGLTRAELHWSMGELES